MEPKIVYEQHPVSPERKAELRGQGFKIIDAVFAPEGQESAKTPAKAKKPATEKAAVSTDAS